MKHLNSKAWLAVAILALVTALLLFIPAGTILYWQAWAYWVVFTGASALMTLYLMRKDPALLARRMRGGPGAEKQPAQKLIMLGMSAGFIALLVVPALDHRWGWSSLSLGAVIAGDALVAIGFYLITLVYRENTFASATIEVAENQRVISTGPYAIVRHPMYASALLYLFGTPLALGSWWGVCPHRCDAAISGMATHGRGTPPRQGFARLYRLPAAGPVSACAVGVVVRYKLTYQGHGVLVGGEADLAGNHRLNLDAHSWTP